MLRLDVTDGELGRIAGRVWEVHYTDFYGRRQADSVNSERAALNVYRNYRACYGDVRVFRLETHRIEEVW